ncbi:CHAT domain-containing protein [Hyalangium versicolor]|uniref:CHAT domain-containing protein n=1 Tax=Hyalangium versicolor TaxID=2861190 RepID=UPI001CCA4401|nr:CHAT domain-containing protein [Hyalangium versicolor]
MNSNGAAATGSWLEIDIAQGASELKATARGSRGEQPRPHSLGAQHSPDTVREFGERVKEAASRAASLESLRPAAQALHAALFQDELQEVLVQLRSAGGMSTLLRLVPQDLELHSIPWEALCRPGADVDFLGTSQQLCIARGVHSTKPWQPREVRGAVRLLVISPSDELAPSRLEAMLYPSISEGEVEWLDPLTGPRATAAYVLQRLRQEPVPHILHFIGHGGFTQAGAPVLQFSDSDSQDAWLRVELLAKELEVAFRDNLRLVVLESCQGAHPGTLTSAAALLAQAGADAVVAYLWPVMADVARRCSSAFYRSLTWSVASRGDVARSLHDARRTVLAEFKESAEAFSPVLYLRSRDSTLFDFKGRNLTPPQASASGEPFSSDDPAVRALQELLARPFSLLLGDHWQATQDGFRQVLHQQLHQTPWAAPQEMPISALAQRYMLEHGDEHLSSRFQEVFQHSRPSLPLVDALARRLKPGVHITLLRLPLLEDAVARCQPELTLYVVQPSRMGDGSLLVRQHVPRQGWIALAKLPGTFNPDQDALLLRLYRGYLPDRVLATPLLTEDDYLLGLRELESVLPPDLADSVLSLLDSRPALLVGLSLLSWDHRMLLHRLFGRRPLPRRSTVLLEPHDAEGDAWRKGRSLPGHTGLQVVQTAFLGMAEFLDADSPRGAK